MKFIGVDPSFRKNGFWCAIIERPQNTVRFFECKTLGDFASFILWEKPDHILIENSNLQKRQFKEGASTKEKQDVGKNMAVSQIAVDLAVSLLALGLPVEISPKKKGPKIVDLNIFLAWLRANTLIPEGYKGLKGEQDKRDAAKLAMMAEQQFKLHQKAKKK